MNAAQFNARYAVGTPVVYRPVLGGREAHATRTRSQAWSLGSGHAVVMVEGFIGGVSIEAVEVIPQPQQGGAA